MNEEEPEAWLHHDEDMKAGALCPGSYRQVVSPLLNMRNAVPCKNISWQTCERDNLYLTLRISSSLSPHPFPFHLIPTVSSFLFSRYISYIPNEKQMANMVLYVPPRGN